MRKDIKSRHAAAIVVLFVLGCALVTQGTHESGQAAWLAVLSAAAVSVPVVAIYVRLQHLHPGKSLYDIAYLMLGRWGGGAVTVLYMLFFLHLVLYAAHMFALFLHATDLPKTPSWAIALPLVFISAWLATLGHMRIAKAAMMLLVVVVFEVVITMLSAIPTYDFTHLLPVIECDTSVLVDDAYSFFVSPFTQTVALLAILHHLPQASARRRGWFVGLLAGALLLCLIYVRTILILGGVAVSEMNYATYRSSSVIKINGFIQRVEMFVSDGFVPALLLKTSLFLYAVGQGAHRLKSSCKPSVAIVVAAALVTLAVPFVTATTAQSFEFLYVLRLYAPVLQVGLPVLLWIVAEIKKKRRPTSSGDGALSELR